MIDRLRPRRFVELGTHSGFSFFAFCQAIEGLRVGTRAFAVDTWAGDEHAGLYGHDVFDRVDVENGRYRGFATLLRSSFDAAVTRFDDASVDLLHVDGLHFYDAVAHDFDVWRPKLTQDAVVLFHDTQVRERDFGVWRLWEELSARHPSFEFVHGHGLGVLCPGTVPGPLRDLVGASDEVRTATRAAYEALGAAVVERRRGMAVASSLDALLARGGEGPEREAAPGPDPTDGADPRVARLFDLMDAELRAWRDAERMRDVERRRVEAAGRDREEAVRLRIEAERQRDEAKARVRDLAARDAEARGLQRTADSAARLLRRSLSAQRRRAERLERDLDGLSGYDHLLEGALAGRDEREARERRASDERHDELLRWGRSHGARVQGPDDRATSEGGPDRGSEGGERGWSSRVAIRIGRLLKGAPASGTSPAGLDEATRRAAAVRGTGLFDEAYYLACNPDVAASGLDATSHYAETGWWEGRRPNPSFDPAFYLAANPDVAEAGQNPLVHYAGQGILEGRRPNASNLPSRWLRPSDETVHPEDAAAVEAVLDTGLFDERYYLTSNPDVAALGSDPAFHFALDGWREGRRPNPNFDPTFYLASNPDVAASGENPLVHYATVGVLEGRRPSRAASVARSGGRGDDERSVVDAVLDTGLFDAEYYRATYPDVPSSDREAALHFARHGWREGRKPNPDFDPALYLAHNPDVAATGVDPLLHFAEHGLLEGRSFHGVPTGPRDHAASAVADYGRWVELHDTLGEGDRRAIRARLRRFRRRPLISVVMPVYNPRVAFLRQAVASVQGQLYPDWELCVADDASPDPAVRDALRAMAADDPRIRLVLRPENGHISAASNSALALASGEFVALMDHDDVLPPHALFEVAAALDRDPDLDVIYSDEDHIDADGRRNNPYFKPDFSPDLMLGQNLVSHLGVYRRALLERIGGFRAGFEGSQDYDLALRAIDASAPGRVHHIPAVLYHWRSATGSDTFSEASLQRCIAAARRAVADHLERRGEPGEVVAHPLLPNWNRVRRPRPAPAPLVSAIVPTRDRADLLGPCVDGLLHRTDYPNLEVLVVDHQSTDSAALALLADLARDPRVRVLPHAGPFNYSAINNAAVRQARGSVLALLNNDVDVIGPEWLDEMVALAVLPGVGAVGAKLLYPDDHVQHAGVILGPGGVAAHAFHRLRAGDAGYFGRAALTATVAAVTAACLVVRRAVFDEAGGFDAADLPVAFNDVDLCLEIRSRGYRNVWTPHACLVHHESVSRGSDLEGERLERFGREVAFMRDKWGDVLDEDPFYSPNLDLAAADFGLAFPPRRRRPWNTRDATP